MSEKVYTIEEIKKLIESAIKEQPVYRVILFGSYAKNEANSSSDIDIIVDSNNELRGFALLNVICLIEEKLQKKIDAFEKYEIIENSKIDEEIKRTGVVIYEK